MHRAIETLLYAFLIALVITQESFYSNPTLHASASNQLYASPPNPGYWGVAPPMTASPFNSVWEDRGHQQMYNLNSRTPFAGNSGSGFDSMTPVFNPIGPTRFEFFPTQSNFMSPGELGSYTYDVNEPRMRQIVQNYFRFFNRDLDRLNNVVKDNTRTSDMNNLSALKLQSPASTDFKSYFDGFSEENTSPSLYLKKYRVKSFFPERERRLNLKKPIGEIKRALSELRTRRESGEWAGLKLERLAGIEQRVKRVERKLALIEKFNTGSCHKSPKLKAKKARALNRPTARALRETELHFNDDNGLI